MAASESASRSSSAADSYIGSLISLTSKSEIRYEGVLYNINTEESSIGLRNVRSFGTEGRKKDGPQIAPSDKIYEYILFRGSDIKDLQVKSSPPVQPPQPVQQINNDPAIIQSHYARPVATSPSLTPAVSGPLPDLGTQPAQPGLPGPNLQGGIPLYQPPGGNLGSWGASPPPPGTNGAGGVQMPMYWPGYYGPPGALPQMPHQQSLLRPPPGLSMPSMPMPYPTFNPPLPSGPPNFPELPPSLATATTSTTTAAATTTTNSATLTSTSLAPSTLPSAIPVLPPTLLSSDQPLPSSIPNKAPSLSPLTTASAASDTTSSLLPLSNKPIMVPGQTLAYLSVSQSTSAVVGLSSSVGPDTSAPLLVTPGQLLQSTGPTPAVSSTPSLQAVHKDVEVVKVPAPSSEGLMPVPAEAQPPILPLPPPTRALPKNGAPFNNRYGSYRGRGRGAGSSHSVTKFSEDFDFTAMNEKFNKDEVWGHLGKKSHPKDKEDDGEISDKDDAQNEDDAALSNFDVEQPVYNKDDFFDSLSSNALDSNSYRGRTRYSEQMKIDTETFGDFPRYRGGGRGGRGFARGGRGRGGGYYGGGYGGYNGRGRGRGMNSRGQ